MVGLLRRSTNFDVSVEINSGYPYYGIQKPAFIDIDLNPDPYYKSNQVLRSAIGYIESFGFKARWKPDAASASYCADKICK